MLLGLWLMPEVCSLSVLRVLHQPLFVPVLTYCSEKMLWKEREGSRIRALQIDNIRGLLGIRRMDKLSNERIK